MRVSGLSLPIGEQRQFEPLSNPAGVPNHPTYVEPNLAYVNPNLTRFVAPESTVLHPPTADLDVFRSSQTRKVGTRYSRHLSTPSAGVAVRVEGSQDWAYRG